MVRPTQNSHPLTTYSNLSARCGTRCDRRHSPELRWPGSDNDLISRTRRGRPFTQLLVLDRPLIAQRFRTATDKERQQGGLFGPFATASTNDRYLRTPAIHSGTKRVIWPLGGRPPPPGGKNSLAGPAQRPSESAMWNFRNSCGSIPTLFPLNALKTSLGFY